MRTIRLYYRGLVKSCNYACSYCPFAHSTDSALEIAADKKALKKFCVFVKEAGADIRFEIMFVPAGEIGILEYYRQAIADLCQMENVCKVAFQTNLSYELDWLGTCNSKLAIWASFHPSETSKEEFVEQCAGLDERVVRYSAGGVALKENRADLLFIQKQIKSYFWLNAYRHQIDYYSKADIAAFAEIDPCFPFTAGCHQPKGKWCECGSESFFIKNGGIVKICNFTDDVLGHINDPDFEFPRKKGACFREECNCYLGFSNFEPYISAQFGSRKLERILKPEMINK